jgi:hypothetical protein
MGLINVEIKMQGNDNAFFTTNAGEVFPANIQIFHVDGRYKFTDGVTALSDLPFLGSGGGGTQNLQGVIDESPKVEGVLAESADGSQKYEITDTGLKLVGVPSTTNKTITLNKDGASNSSTGSGIVIEENSNIVGYIRTAIGSAFDFLHPLNANYARISLNLLTGNRTYNLPDNSGTFETKPTQKTGTALTFESNAVYGTIASPETGNITFSTTGANLMTTLLVIHNSGTIPTYTGLRETNVSKGYSTGVINYMLITYINPTEITITIFQRA